MRMSWEIAVVPLLVLFAAAHCDAQTQSDAEKHLAAANELLIAMQVDKTYSESMDRIIDLQQKQNPMLEPYRSVFRKFFERYMNWESLKVPIADAYMQEFSTSELIELAAFYRTPLGQKVGLSQPKLIGRTAEIGMQRVQEHLGEFQEMIEMEMQKNGENESVESD